MQNYKNHRISAEGLIILTENGTVVLVPFAEASKIVKDLQRQLGDFHDQGDDKQRPYPAPMKYGQAL